MEILNAIENNTLTYWLRESPSVFAYPTLIAIHTFGMVFLVGPSTGIALRVLGYAETLPLASLRPFFRVIAMSAWVSIISGVLLAILDVRILLIMPTFYIKMLAIVAAMVIIRRFRSRVFSAESSDVDGIVTSRDKLLAGVLLFGWGVAVAAGRVTAYDAFIVRETVVAVVVCTVVLFAGGYLLARIRRSGEPAERESAAPSTVAE